MCKNYIKCRKICFYVSVFIITALPIVLYIINFGNSKKYALSDDPADWGAFGDYFGGVYSVIVAVFVIYLARKLNKEDNKRNEIINAAKQLYQQIIQVENSKYNLNSITKLQRDVIKYEMYIPEKMTNELMELADMYVLVNNDNGAYDLKLKNQVLSDLKYIYDAY